MKKITKRTVPLTEEELLKKLPVILCSPDGKKPKLSKEKLEKLAEFIKWNY